MGKWIDRFALLLLLSFALYALFLHAFGSIIAACAFTFACCTILLRALKFKGKKYRMTRLQAEAILQQWAYGPDEIAKAAIAQLLNADESTLIYLPRHPSASISMGDVFSAWKSHRSDGHIIVSAPCYADARAKAFAKTLKSPTVSISDAAQLIPRLRRSDIPAPRSPQGRQLMQKIRELFASLPGRRPWYKNLGIGLMLMLLYLITGSAAYLILSISALFLSGAGLRMRA